MIVNPDIRTYGSAVMPDSDSPTNIGGAIDTSRSVVFVDGSGALQAVSSDDGDTTQSLTVSYLDSGGDVQTLVLDLDGQTPVTDATAIVSIVKAIKGATCAGVVSLEFQSAVRSGTCQGGSSGAVTLDAGASSVDDYYRDMVCRLTDSGQITRILDYDGATKIAHVSGTLSPVPTGSSTFVVSRGMVFEVLPDELMEIRALMVGADVARTGHYVEKYFLKNCSGSDLTSAVLHLISEPSGRITFGAAAVDDDGDNGAFNRATLPAGISFDVDDVSIGTVAAGSAVPVWLDLSLLAAGAKTVEALDLVLQADA